MVSFENLSIIVFLAILGALIIKDRKNIVFKGLMFTRRTEKGKDKIKKFGEKYSKQLKIYANIAIVTAIIASVAGSFFLLKSLTLAEPGVRLLFPKVFPGEPSEAVQKHISFIPIWYWVITIFIIIVPHELSHGFVAAAEKIRIQSLGLALFLIFPGAFVEPDEEQFKKSKPLTRMRVAAVGSFANFLVFILLLLVVLGLGLLPERVFIGDGVSFEATIPDTPAAEVGLKGTIKEMDGVDVNDLGDLSAILDSTEPGQEIQIVTTEGEFTLKTAENPDVPGSSYIGISNPTTADLQYTSSLRFLGNPETGAAIFLWFFNLFTWAAFLDFNIAIANLLPMLPLDGGLILHAIIEKFSSKKLAEKVIVPISIVTFVVLLLNLIGMGTVIGWAQGLINLVSLFF
jgi:membrane-associated protease RseP (regulator of RpoE activity)